MNRWGKSFPSHRIIKWRCSKQIKWQSFTARPLYFREGQKLKVTKIEERGLWEGKGNATRNRYVEIRSWKCLATKEMSDHFSWWWQSIEVFLFVSVWQEMDDTMKCMVMNVWKSQSWTCHSGEWFQLGWDCWQGDKWEECYTIIVPLFSSWSTKN